MLIISREEWGARRPAGFAEAPLPARELYLHHSVTVAPDLLPPFDDDDAAVRTLERIGHDRFGGGISYTFAVTPLGRVYEGHGVGRRGAHTGGRNSISRAIVLVGDYDRQKPPDTAVRAVAELVAHGHRAGWWPARLTGGHRDAPGASTACPGRHAYVLIPDINRQVAGLLALAPTKPTSAPRPAHLEDDMFTDDDRAMLRQLARRDDVGHARSQILSRLGVVDPVAYPTRRTPEDIAADDLARRNDVGHALTRILAALDASPAAVLSADDVRALIRDALAEVGPLYLTSKEIA
ncbi:MAG TPA: N-acetylmuramoyl-L-alanine amidase [Naasia sp.]